MNNNSKAYEIVNLKVGHIETLDKLYGCIADDHTGLKAQLKKLPGVPFRALAGYLKPKFILESSVIKPAKKIKAFAQKVLLHRKNDI